ncbi:MAG TPA: hypothetical protein PK523_13535, partial [Elusimicrobiales bacterium]|nr:hypothetical protein [Elusimicrobiales bacterium]
GASTINGTLSADGGAGANGLFANGSYGAGGGGSGGSIHLLTASLTGSGTISAKGGAAGDDDGNGDKAGGGGGGLIRIDPASYTSNDFTGAITVDGGPRSPTEGGVAADGDTGIVEAPLAALADNDGGQRANSVSEGTIVGANLLGFKLTAYSQTARVSSVIVRLSAVTGVVDGDWSNVRIYQDTDGNGRRDPGEDTAVGGAGAVNTAGGTITFSTAFTFPTAGMDYVVTADLAGLAGGDTFTLNLSTSDIAAVSVTDPSEKALKFTGGKVSEAVHTVSNVVVWDGETGDGKWHTADNWDPNIVPVPESLVTIDADVTVEAESSQPGIRFNTLALGNADGTTLP